MSLYLKIKYYLRRIYRLSLPTNKWEDLVWKDLKQLHLDAKWHSGVHEHEKLINCVFNINDNKSLQYFHYIHYGQFHVRVKVVEEFEEEFTSDLFILATHFNNILVRGKVVINPGERKVEYVETEPILIPLLFSGDLYDHITRHFNTSKTIYAAFHRLLYDGESPAIIIADVLNENNNEENKTK